MAQATRRPQLELSLLLLVLLLGTAHEVHSLEGKKALSLRNSLWDQLTSTPNCFSQKSIQKNGATILEIVHQAHCSGKTVNWNQKQQKRLILDDARVRTLQHHIKNANSNDIKDVAKTQLPLTSGVHLQTLNYIVTMELGGRNMSVILDTGSDLTWVQCQPCTVCYSQQDPLFNPSASPSYKSILCNSSTCQSLEYATGNSGVCRPRTPICNYFVSYGDGSYTRGELGVEHLNLGATPLDNFVFGCGRNNKGLFGGASGLMGLGRSSLSMASQTSNLFGGVFSYCLPSAEVAESGSLAFGGDFSVYKNNTPISYTAMIPNPQLPTFYFLNLTGISVGGAAIQSLSFGKAGILIDSGTVISRLPPSMYRALKEAFLMKFTGYPPAPGFSILDTCFNLSAYQEVEIPTIDMHFDGDANLKADVNGIFYFAKTDASQVCLALASLTYEDEIGIIGNYQQKNQRVVYDTMGSKLGFAGETCSFV
ncbi:aspartyl protease family protein At5g10770 [Rhodamnia argentea]|uniref:Aspartyl protease family protein At5g10770 n=1 Tax=Rhodamnia argentea TaxID=178133 RepID=A0A8B8QVZ8_9MYRT|nr:aspartyl protease family protein At5g10770 [Rhodamnia argentea]